MKLEKWLDSKSMTRSAFAAKVGCAPSYVTMLIQGQIWPSREMAKAIRKVTRGKVTPNDFIDIA